MSQETLSDNELAMLTEAERIAMQEDDGRPVIEPEEEIVIETEQTPTEEVIETPVAVDEVPAVEPAPEVELPTTERYPNVTFTDTVPAEMAASLVDLDKQLENGDIDIAAYMSQRTVIDKQITSFQFNEAAEQRNYNSWMDAQDVFMRTNRQYADSKILYSALDSAVREVRSTPRAQGLTPAEILVAADILVKGIFGVKATPATTTESKPSVVTKPNNTLPNIPILSNVPASSANETGADPFSAIDRLSGNAKEAALAKLTPEQYDAYLRV